MRNLSIKILAIAILSLVAVLFGVCKEQTAKLPLRVVNDVPSSSPCDAP